MIFIGIKDAVAVGVGIKGVGVELFFKFVGEPIAVAIICEVGQIIEVVGADVAVSECNKRKGVVGKGAVFILYNHVELLLDAHFYFVAILLVETRPSTKFVVVKYGGFVGGEMFKFYFGVDTEEGHIGKFDQFFIHIKSVKFGFKEGVCFVGEAGAGNSFFVGVGEIIKDVKCADSGGGTCEDAEGILFAELCVKVFKVSHVIGSRTCGYVVFC